MQQVKAVCLNSNKGPKIQVDCIELLENWGVIGDYHAATGSNRQVSLLLDNEIEKIIQAGYTPGIGAFGENIIISGIEIGAISIGDTFVFNESIELLVTIIGKECHTPCIIQQTTGKCIMPETGIFCKVLKGGVIKNGDWINHCK
ncbi:MAG: hypothetical protein A2015_06785 [Spirochaetes bacterium GWF1_31_7]|nr:MAG: hypothetical protein A2Y30_09675 [Spirochaetes bacterium GWE1_32_154]OHD46537.1 MAG: hypothetical protein A2015_06785 [Spirochaetes bacterium GWF1_31_7]OHD49346.1 MAG: hypothetical protein A2Y29_03780 [Spirochaetes bacterium GWE2_31_10]OHD77185.1 MAG: hypothetical protein A2355_02680 [Spirochaetes bacterium RIFOXYB1_FULL_32_8]HBD93085.1 MOSC domain-containing protein [Spirochaetia bacterium]